MPASSLTAPVPTPPPPPAYPDPIHLPVAPHGDPLAAQMLADAYRTLAERLDHTTAHVTAISTDLATRWHGHGATALQVPTDTLHQNLRTLTQSYRSAADHLNDYANALHKAQHHHGWSLSKIIAIGAVVTIGVAVVVVTVGAAAPLGTLAAAEVGEAILGAETAAATATAAETTATTALSLTGQTMTGLRTLTTLALPHLTQGAINTSIDTAIHLATGHPVTAHDLELAFLTGTLTSATTTTTRSALHATNTYTQAGTLTRAALDTTAITTTLTTDTALGQYATTGHLNPTTLTKSALLTALTGGAATLRHPLAGTGGIAKPVPTGQSLEDLSNNPDLRLHQGPQAPYGHTLSKHVDKDEAWLRQRLNKEPWISDASSFSSRAEAEAAVRAAVNKDREGVAELLSGQRKRLEIRVDLPTEAGVVLRRVGDSYLSKHAVVRLRVVNHNLVVVSAFLE